jgi:hypothetical protein
MKLRHSADERLSSEVEHLRDVLRDAKLNGLRDDSRVKIVRGLGLIKRMYQAIQRNRT